jgi:CheY-like chemotaxis protein
VNQIPDLKILIVEDDPTSEIIITRAVRSISKELLNVRNGKDAVETCRNTPDIDLVLMDIQLPYIDGYEATRLIREFNKSVIIIAQTAYALTGDKDKSIEAGCNDYISKPINKDLLLTIIRKQFEIHPKIDV